MTDKLTTLFAEVLKLPAADLNEDSSPETVRQWDSLGAMHLVAAIEETFSVRLKTTEIMAMNSIGSARAVLQKKGAAGL